MNSGNCSKELESGIDRWIWLAKSKFIEHLRNTKAHAVKNVLWQSRIEFSKRRIAELPLRAGSYALRRFMRYSYMYEAHMSPTLNRSSAIQRFEGNDVIEICDRLTFDFYTGLPHVWGIHASMLCIRALPLNQSSNIAMCLKYMYNRICSIYTQDCHICNQQFLILPLLADWVRSNAELYHHLVVEVLFSAYFLS